MAGVSSFWPILSAPRGGNLPMDQRKGMPKDLWTSSDTDYVSKGYWRKRYVKIRDNLNLVTPISPKTRRCLATMRGGRIKRLNQHKARPPTKRKPSGSGTDTSPMQTNPHKQYRGEHQSIVEQWIKVIWQVWIADSQLTSCNRYQTKPLRRHWAQ